MMTKLFLGLNTLDIIVLLVIGILLTIAIIYMIKNRGKCSSCEGCKFKDSCDKKKNK